MRKISKITVFVLAFVFVFLFAACGKDENKSEAVLSVSPTVNNSSQEPTQSPTEDPSSVPTQAPTDNKEPESEAKPTITPGQLTYAGGILSETPPELQVMICDTNGTPTHFQIMEDLAIQFFPSVAFTEVSVCCPSYSDNVGTLTFALYSWMGSYESTLAGDPIKTQTFENYNDNDLLSLKFEEALPDGEYILYMTTPKSSEGVGVWAKIGDFEGQKIYFDAGQMLDENSRFHVELRASYINTPNNLYGKVS